MHIEVVGPELAESRVQLQRDSFGEVSTFTIQQWHTMAASPAYRSAGFAALPLRRGWRQGGRSTPLGQTPIMYVM